jgi:putative heme-binding domain-containing protein
MAVHHLFRAAVVLACLVLRIGPPGIETSAGAAQAAGDKDDRSTQTRITTAPAPLAAIKTPADLKVELVLAEPVVRQPVFINFDERGRLWVVQYLQYPAPAGLKVLSRDGYWRAVYDKVPPPPPHHTRGDDKITIHEDTDGDGVFDKHKTFLDGLNIVTAVARGRGGVWVLNPPYLLFYADRDNDDVPDGDPEVHLEGFGLEDTHSVVNSLCWGPDGWLYAAQGSTVSGHVRRPGDKDVVRSMGQNIWRYHPERRRYEVFAEGGGNAFGVEIDSQGHVFSGHNGGDTRGFHYVQGGYLQKGFDKHGPLSNPYAFGYFPAMKHNRTPRFTHTFIKYEADALPTRYHGKLFAVAPLLSHVMLADIQPEGSTFRTQDIETALASSDLYFRPVDVKLGPDGAVYVADWSDAQVAHTRNQEGQIDKSNGRIYRIAADRHSFAPHDVGKLSSRELVDMLGDSNRTMRHTALRLLGDRKDQAILPLLRARLLAGMSEPPKDPLPNPLPKGEGVRALELLWALHLSGGLDKETAGECLRHADPRVRLWTARLLCDFGSVSATIARQLRELATSEKSIEVRSQLACSARRLPAANGLPIVRALLNHNSDTDDPRLPLLLWWAIEAKCDSDRAAVIALFNDRDVWSLPVVERHLLERLMRRFAAAGTRGDLITCSQLLKLAPADNHRRKLMAGFEAAYAGRSVANLPDDLLAAIDQFAAASPMLGLRQGKAGAVDLAAKTILDDKSDPTVRLQYVQILGEVHQPRAIPALLQLAVESSDSALRSAAMLALRRYDDSQIPSAVLAVYPKLTEDERAAALRLLVSRGASALALLDAVERGGIDAATVPADVLLELQWRPEESVQTRVKKLFPGAGRVAPAELKEEISRLQSVVAARPGTPKVGRELFAQHCAKCHTLFGKGGVAGPELTTYPRQDTNNLLLHIVDPNTAIREGYLTSVVTMSDGRTLAGVIADQDNQTVVLRGSDGKDLPLARNQIELVQPATISLMPEGLLRKFKDDEVRDLFAYLRSSQPVIDQ